MSERNLTLVGFLTWAIIAVPSVASQWRAGVLLTPSGALWAACFAGFIVLYAVAVRHGCPARVAVALIAAETIFGLTCVALRPDGFQPVLLVIVAGQIGFLPLRAAMVWVVVQSVCLWFAVPFDKAASMTTAYFAFQLFAVFTARIAHEESGMRKALSEANAELKVATGLLDISSRTEERLRIARDLHDLLGHHLTALSLNLEVASHITEGPAREHVEKSRALTKLLLSDVRDVVGRLRDQEPIDLARAVSALRDVIPQPALHVEVGELVIDDPEVARVALRAIQEIVTNAVRHSGAGNLHLRLARGEGVLTIAARDDGAGTDEIRFGNGLRGMRERVEERGGSLRVKSSRGEGFAVEIDLPL